LLNPSPIGGTDAFDQFDDSSPNSDLEMPNEVSMLDSPSRGDPRIVSGENPHRFMYPGVPLASGDRADPGVDRPAAPGHVSTSDSGSGSAVPQVRMNSAPAALATTPGASVITHPPTPPSSATREPTAVVSSDLTTAPAPPHGGTAGGSALNLVLPTRSSAAAGGSGVDSGSSADGSAPHPSPKRPVIRLQHGIVDGENPST
jgi:hypothetical protein